jgi:hypothetical protein
MLRKFDEGLALGAVGFRIIEAVFYIAGVMVLLVLLTLSQEFVKAGAPDPGYFQTLGVLLLAGYHWVGNVGSLLAGVLLMFRAIGPMSTYQVVLAVPIGVQEMVFAVWLIVKGFNPVQAA